MFQYTSKRVTWSNTFLDIKEHICYVPMDQSIVTWSVVTQTNVLLTELVRFFLSIVTQVGITISLFYSGVRTLVHIFLVMFIRSRE